MVYKLICHKFLSYEYWFYFDDGPYLDLAFEQLSWYNLLWNPMRTKACQSNMEHLQEVAIAIYQVQI